MSHKKISRGSQDMRLRDTARGMDSERAGQSSCLICV